MDKRLKVTELVASVPRLEADKPDVAKIKYILSGARHGGFVFRNSPVLWWHCKRLLNFKEQELKNPKHACVYEIDSYSKSLLYFNVRVLKLNWMLQHMNNPEPCALQVQKEVAKKYRH